MLQCISEKCPKCNEDDFRASCYRCAVDNRALRKGMSAPCYIEDEIKYLEKRLKNAKKLKDKIISHQSKGE